MSTAIQFRVEGDGMTRRARVYMFTAAGRHLVVGACCAFYPQAFMSGTYLGITSAFSYLPMLHVIIIWGWLFIFTGIMCVMAGITGSEKAARTGLLLSVVTTACWGGGFLAAIITGVSSGPTGAVVWLALALKDATMLRQPLRNPFEPLVQKVIADQRRRCA